MPSTTSDAGSDGGAAHDEPDPPPTPTGADAQERAKRDARAKRERRRGRVPSRASAVSRQRSKSPESYVQPSAVRYGNERTRLRRRSSIGSIASSRAAASIVVSIRYVASGRPAPRYGPVGTLFVRTPVTKTSTAAMS